LQERGARRAAERAFGSQHADALLDPQASQRGGADPARVSHRPPPPAPTAEPDPAIDYIVEFASAQAGAQTTVQEEWPQSSGGTPGAR
jgi:hypothetical protein